MENIKLSNNIIYNVNDLVSYMSENINDNLELNLDLNLLEKGIYSTLWKNEDEKSFILLHPGLKQDVKINYHNRLKEERKKYLKEILINFDSIHFLGFFGFCLINNKNIKNFDFLIKLYNKIIKNNIFLLKNIKNLDKNIFDLGLELMIFYINTIIFLEEENKQTKLLSFFKKINDKSYISFIKKENNLQIIIFKKNFCKITNYHLSDDNFNRNDFYKDYDKISINYQPIE